MKIPPETWITEYIISFLQDPVPCDCPTQKDIYINLNHLSKHIICDSEDVLMLNKLIHNYETDCQIEQ